MKVANRQYISGFTLLELLIAISIFSMLSVMAYGGLKTVLDSRDANQRIAKRVSEVQLAMLRVSNDLQHAVERTVRDAFGTPLPSMMTLQSAQFLLEWTRSGYNNLSEFKRSNLQRVAYNLKESELNEKLDLVRITWPVLDRTQGTEPVESIIISGIESLEWKFNDRANNSSSGWPSDALFAAGDITTLPRAVEMTLTFEDIGEIRRVVLVP